MSTEICRQYRILKDPRYWNYQYKFYLDIAKIRKI